MNKVTYLDDVKTISVSIDTEHLSNTVDGFGVNINPQNWDNGQLVPVMDTLRNDLGATLYRLDVFGQSNWVDPDNKYDRSILNAETYEIVYSSKPFQNTWALARWLNAHGIEPYLNASGVVPRWMCDEDAQTLTDYVSFAEMMGSMLAWARQKENIKFHLFGPLNETDCGPPEGPRVNPDEYAKVLEILVDDLDRRGMQDVNLVAPEPGGFGPEFVMPILASRRLLGRVGVIGMHTYYDIKADAIPKLLSTYEDSNTRFWMTEYGDLDETGAKEWEVAWSSTRRLLKCMRDGAQAGLVWDAFDNYHDHDASWSLYGLLRKGIREYTPKKRYYAAKQLYRFISPGSMQVFVDQINEDYPILSFVKNGRITIVGMNPFDSAVRYQFRIGQGGEKHLEGYVTSPEFNCCKTGNYVTVREMLDVVVPGNAIFTYTEY